MSPVVAGLAGSRDQNWPSTSCPEKNVESIPPRIQALKSNDYAPLQSAIEDALPMELWMGVRTVGFAMHLKPPWKALDVCE